MIVRRETKKDYDEIYNLIKEAFAQAERSDGTEQDLAAALRESAAFVPELALVAELDGKIAGHIMFSEANVGEDTVLVLAPLSVLPEFQKKGVGSALIKEAHRIARELGYQYCLVLGSEKYYPRFGYFPAKEFGVEVPEGMPSENFMAVKLCDSAKEICGSVKYAEEFGI